MEITSDPRLHAGVRAALEHICERHGLNKEEQHELVASFENECASGAGGSAGANCAVTIDEMDDRVEVTVGTARDPSGKINSREASAARQKAKANGAGVTVLVKHFQKNAAHS